MSSPSEPRDAATLLLIREAAPDGFELFMVKRHKRSGFMAEAMVFPGGRLDEADCADALAERCDLDRAAAAARLGMTDGARALGLLVAGARETFEEAGVLLATRGDVPLEPDDSDEVARLRRHRDALNAGETTLLDIAREEDLTLSTAALRFVAHWVTPEAEPRRYDTRFLAVRAPAGQKALHDEHETTASAWMTPAAALHAYDAGEILLAPPTLRILLTLRGLPDEAAVLAVRGEGRPPCIRPRLQVHDDELHLLLPGDPDYDPEAGKSDGANDRFLLRDGRWVSIGRVW